jgi:hypothetical protein
MFKGFSDSSRNKEFHGFPNLNFQMNNEAYGFSGCTFWLDAAHGLNTQTDLAAVSLWEDKIRNIKFTQSTAGNQPQLVINSVNFNNYPAVRFQSNARYLSSFDLVDTSNNFTIAFVAKLNTANSTHTNALMSNLGTPGAGYIGLRKTTTNGIGWYGSSSSVQMDSGIIDTNPHIVVVTNNEIVVDGVQTVTGSYTPLISWSVIGSSNTGWALQSDVAEIIIFNNLLNSDDCITLSDNINSKYAIY